MSPRAILVVTAIAVLVALAALIARDEAHDTGEEVTAGDDGVSTTSGDGSTTESTTAETCAVPLLPCETRAPFDPAPSWEALGGVEERLEVWPSPSPAWTDPQLDAGTTFASDGSDVGATWALGDLDGDGEMEVLVFVSGNRGGAYVVPGTVPSGTHEPADVGVRLPPDGFYATIIGPNRLGDVDGDGRDDVMFAAGNEHRVHPGAPFLEPGPGGQLDELPKPVAVHAAPSDPPGPYLKTWVLRDGLDATAVPVTADPVDGDVIVTVGGSPPVRLRTGADLEDDPEASGGEATGWLARSGNLTFLRRDGHPNVALFFHDQARVWLWNLDQPC